MMHNDATFFEVMCPIVKEFMASKKFATKYKMKTFDCFQLQSIRKRNNVIILHVKTDRDHVIYIKGKLWGVVYETACIIRAENSFFVIDRADTDLNPQLREFIETVNELVSE